MKKSYILFSLLAFTFTVLVFTGWKNPSENTATIFNPGSGSTDSPWAGTYRGTLPCNNCEGVQTELTLNKNKTFDLILRFIGKKDATKAFTDKFSISKEGNIITLGGMKDAGQPTQYLIADNSLVQLGIDGKRIEGENADKYVLIKGKPSIEEKYWKLIQLHGSEVSPEPGNRREANLMLKAEGDRLTGSGGCNTFSGNYVITNENGITFSKVAATQLECPSMETEPKFLRVLSIVDQYKISGDTLMLSKGANPPSAKFVSVY